MKKIFIIMLLVLASTMALAQTSVWHGDRTIWTRGSGTENDPFLIESADNLAFLAYVVNKCYDTEGLYFRLTTDIDLNGSEDLQWAPIGGGMGGRWFNEDGCYRGNPSGGFYGGIYPCFRGHFDGGEHSISNIYIDIPENENSQYIGLFGLVQGKQENQEIYPAVIENVFVTSGYIKGKAWCGGIVGSGNNVLISRCWNGATIEGNSVGGIVGGNSQGKVYNCYNVGALTGNYVGGIVGVYASEIVECYNEGDITANDYGGGICGRARVTTINNCYNTGSVSGTTTGGLVGSVIQSCTITNCYNVGDVSSTNNMGCLIGLLSGNITVGNCYYLNTCTESEYGEPKSEDYMRTQDFVDLLNGENEEHVWVMDVNHTNSDFPILITIDLAVPEITEATFNVYPNPAQDRFTVEGTGRMTVSNLLGQVVLVKEIVGQTTVALPRGMYFVKLGNETRKIVVE